MYFHEYVQLRSQYVSTQIPFPSNKAEGICLHLPLGNGLAFMNGEAIFLQDRLQSGVQTDDKDLRPVHEEAVAIVYNMKA